jgi:hypothetical protein
MYKKYSIYAQNHQIQPILLPAQRTIITVIYTTAVQKQLLSQQTQFQPPTDMTTAYCIMYHSEDDPSNWLPGYTTDTTVWERVLDMATSDITARFKASAGSEDRGVYGASVKDEMRLRHGGIASTANGGEISQKCKCILNLI